MVIVSLAMNVLMVFVYRLDLIMFVTIPVIVLFIVLAPKLQLVRITFVDVRIIIVII